MISSFIPKPKKFMANEKLPKISVVTCTYNGERIIERYFEYLFSQDYPLNKIEVILADGGSTDKTLDIIKKYREKYPKNIKFLNNPAKTKVGRGKGADIATRKSKGEFLVLIDQDNLLIQKDWLRKMVKTLLDNPDIIGVQSRHSRVKNSSLIDKYLNSIGIEDPFVIDYALNPQITFNPKKFQYNKKGKFYVYNINEKNFYYAGDNGYITRRKEFFENKGYTQDIDNFYRMALSKKKYKIAVLKNSKLHHNSALSMKHLLNKKVFYVRKYLGENYEGRDFYWFDLNKNSFKKNLRFIKTVVLNLLFFPALIQAIKMYFKKREKFWFIHPVATFLMTLAYIEGFFMSKFLKEQKEVKI